MEGKTTSSWLDAVPSWILRNEEPIERPKDDLGRRGISRGRSPTTIAISEMVSICLSEISIGLHRGVSSSVHAFHRSLVQNDPWIERAQIIRFRRGCPGVGWMALVGKDGAKPSVVHAAFVDGLARAHA